MDITKKLEQQKKELCEEEKRLNEQEQLLRKEKENFTNESIEKERELQLIALQMQLWDISAKLDVVASSNSSFVKADGFYPKLEEVNYCGVPVYTTNGYSQHENNSNNAVNIPQQQQNATVNQSWGQQWPCYLPTAHTSSVVTSTSQCNLPYQQMNSMCSSIPYVPHTQVSFPNIPNDYHFGIPKYSRNINDHDTPKNWRIQNNMGFKATTEKKSKATRALLFNDTSLERNNGHSAEPLSLQNSKIQPSLRPNSKNKKRSTHLQAIIPTSKANSMNSNSSTDCKISVSADSFWDSCHWKLERGEPPHRTISDYCNIAKKQSHDIRGNFPERSLSAVSQYTNNLPDFSSRQTMQLKLEHSRNAIGDTVASDVSLSSLIRKPIYTSDESADYSQLCITTSNYGEQEVSLPSEPQIFTHQNNELQPFPTYQIYHKLVSIVGGSELTVRRVGSDADWPVFFVIPTTALQHTAAECFDLLCPTQKLNANRIAVGTLCVVECNDFKRTKVRAVIERFSENLVDVRHIDDGHMETIPRNQLWSIEDLSANVRTQPALAIPCILASLNEAQLVKTINYCINEIPCVGQLMHVLFKEQRNSDGVWIVELINGMNNDNGAE
ncbi:Tudor domain family protein [Acanthocheilonema viteae]